MKKLLLSLIFALVALTGLQAQTIWDGKADTEWYNETSTKFEISTAEQLAGLAELVNNGKNFSNKTVRLTADIVLNNTSEWENWKSSAPANTWTPIGNSDNYFRGTFDGQGHTVSGIYINSENDFQGLFGYNEGTIKNIGVTKSYIKGNDNVGGVCGLNNGTISNCYNTATVSGGYGVGGVCGRNYDTISNCSNSGNVSGGYSVGGVCGDNWDGTISNCYNSGTVNGSDNYVGGVCGDNDGTISNCYNSGTINGNDQIGGVCGYNRGGTSSNCYNSGIVNGDSYVGGVCGENNNGTISNCYYLQGTAEGGINGSDVSGQAEVKTAEQFASGEVCWLLNCNSDENPTWFQTINIDDSPVLDNTHCIVYAIGNCPNDSNNTYNNNGPSVKHPDSNNDGRCDFCNKIITQKPVQKDGFYQISNRAELYWFAELVNGIFGGVEQSSAANAELIADIIINENVLNSDGNLTANTEGLLAWTPIGNKEIQFKGTFDGQGYTVSGIYINSENDHQGLFGYNEGTIKNIGVTKSYIKGNDNVGGVCGKNSYGRISDCYNSGTVSNTGNGSSYVGGVCGVNYEGFISNCYNSGTITGAGNGSSDVGGVCGYNIGSIYNCYNSGTVSGTDNDYVIGVGGVCGFNNYDGSISNCYNTGTVSGTGEVGGVCGENGQNSSVSNCYNLGNVSGTETFASIGGVCGVNISNSDVSDCYNSGTVSGGYNSGGVCGYNHNGGVISDCYNSGTVSGDGYVGGVCGYNNYDISNCYNSGEVNGDSCVGGICGTNNDDSSVSNCYNSGTVNGNYYVGGVCGVISDGKISNCYYLQYTATGGINGSDARGQAEAKTAEQFASGEVCWLLNEEQSYGAWGQKLGTDPYPLLGGPAVFKDGETYYNEEGSAIVETNSEQASFVIVSENLTIKIYGNDHEATVYNLAGNIVYKGSERIIPVTTAGMYLVRIGNEIQKTVVR